MSRRVVGLCLLAVVLVVGGAAGSEFAITIDGSYDTPEDTVTVDGEEFDVTAISVVEPGEELSVEVAAPEQAEYQINLYTVDQQIQQFHNGLGSEQVSFATDIHPGSYVVAAVENQEFHAVHPVVVADYRVAVDAPDRVHDGTAFDVSTTIDPIAGETEPGEVELVFWSEQHRERFTMSEIEDGQYEQTVDGVESGTYDLYAVVVAAERIGGEESVVGISEPQLIVLDEDLDQHRNDTDSNGDPGSNGSDDADSDGSDDAGSDGDNSSDVLLPSEGSSDDADDDGAGFGVAAALLAISSCLLLARYR